MGHWVWTLGKVGLGKQTAKRRSGGVTLLLTDIRVDEKAEALKVRLIGRRMSGSEEEEDAWRRKKRIKGLDFWRGARRRGLEDSWG